MDLKTAGILDLCQVLVERDWRSEKVLPVVAQVFIVGARARGDCPGFVDHMGRFEGARVVDFVGEMTGDVVLSVLRSRASRRIYLFHLVRANQAKN